MPSRRLTRDEASKADILLAEIKAMVVDAAEGDPVLLFALRRLYTRLMYCERITLDERTKLKAMKHKSQAGLCAICKEAMDIKESELGRGDPVNGYTAENTRLVHHLCHRRDQEIKKFR